MTALEPDRDQIEIFVDAVFRHASPQGFVSLRSFYEGRPEPFSIVPVAFNGDRRLRFLVDNAEKSARTAAQASNPVVFAPPLALFDNRKTAGEADIAEAVALSVECDQQPRQARQKLQEVLGLPTLVVTRRDTASATDMEPVRQAVAAVGCEAVGKITTRADVLASLFFGHSLQSAKR
jgi:hypothetical protein